MVKSWIVIEPHADDAYLSMDAHIRMWGKLGDLVTILTVEPTSRRLAEAAAYAKSVGASWWPYEEWCAAPTPGRQIFPLGIQNPDHKAVREQLAPQGAWFYVDQPYARIQKNAAEVTELLLHLHCVSYLQPGAAKCKGFEYFKTQAKFFHYNPMEKLVGSPEMIFAPPFRGLA